ncbi:MAG: toxin-antitoxin system YwqK family antitoxin [Flavobacteriales bacterium]|jgi:antitoxin component YwqK of YwqJK toxin-antitoxin module|nr:toxin-antitoxin system YwqK family antitoxin [Flavobacteriales bacterium]MBT6746861.1 toxin-antitoxin system YwqK family antitoxin [Flavobacteriales bacterium]
MRNKVLNITCVFIFLSFWNVSASQTSQIYDGDTINVVDENNMKQGHWIYFGNMKNIPGYSPDQKVEEGSFKNNRKSGAWTKYFADESTKSVIEYINNRPNGAYKIYYENGVIQEQGIWKNNRNIGAFVRKYPNGQVQQAFSFSEGGKRKGVQKYFFPNGQEQIVGEWNEGKEDGPITEYYPNGDVKSVKVFNGGQMDTTQTKHYEPTNEIKAIVVDDIDDSKSAPIIDENDVLLETNKTPKGTKTPLFDGNGPGTLYNKNRHLSQKGNFKNGKLMDGKWYRYDENGLLVSIEIYKNGKYIGEAQIEE